MQRPPVNAVPGRKKCRFLVGIGAISVKCAECVRAFVTHISHGEREGWANRLLNAQIPSVDRRQTQRIWPRLDGNVVIRRRQQSIGRHSRKYIGRRTCAQRKGSRRCSGSIVVDTLIRQNRKILGNRMPKNGTEHAQVKASSVTRANDCFGMPLVGKPNPGGKRFPGWAPSQIAGNTAYSGNADESIVQIHQAPVLRSICGLRKIQFPAKAIVYGQLGSHTPRILSVEKQPLLKLLRVERTRNVRILNIAAERGHVAQNKRSET